MGRPGDGRQQRPRKIECYAGGCVRVVRRRAFAALFRGKVSRRSSGEPLFRGIRKFRKEDVGEAELPHVADAHRVQDAVQVVALVLHDEQALLRLETALYEQLRV